MLTPNMFHQITNQNVLVSIKALYPIQRLALWRLWTKVDVETTLCVFNPGPAACNSNTAALQLAAVLKNIVGQLMKKYGHLLYLCFKEEDITAKHHSVDISRR